MLRSVQSGLILLVDADRRVQRGVSRAATECGLEVVACDTARAGVNAACALEPVAIVTELELPDQDGFWFVAQIREQPTDVAACPIVVVTHEIDSSSRARTLQAGADVFLQKPIAAGDLVAQVRALIDMAHRVADRKGAASSSSRLSVTNLPAITKDASETATIPAKAAPENAAPSNVSPENATPNNVDTENADGSDALTIRPAPLPSPALVPLSGDLDSFSVPTLLIAAELQRSTGTLTLLQEDAESVPLALEIASGSVVAGRIQDHPLDALSAFRAAMAIKSGTFHTQKEPDRPAPSDTVPTGKLFALLAVDAPPRSRRNADRPADSPSRPPPDSAPRSKRGATKPPPKEAAPRSRRTGRPPSGKSSRPPEKGLLDEVVASQPIPSGSGGASRPAVLYPPLSGTSLSPARLPTFGAPSRLSPPRPAPGPDTPPLGAASDGSAAGLPSPAAAAVAVSKPPAKGPVARLAVPPAPPRASANAPPRPLPRPLSGATVRPVVPVVPAPSPGGPPVATAAPSPGGPPVAIAAPSPGGSPVATAPPAAASPRPEQDDDDVIEAENET